MSKDIEDILELVGKVDLSTDEKLMNFNLWKNDDGRSYIQGC